MLYPLLLIPGPVSLSLSVRDAMRLPALSLIQTEYVDLLKQIGQQLLGLYGMNSQLWNAALSANTMNSVFNDLTRVLAKERKPLYLAYCHNYLQQFELSPGVLLQTGQQQEVKSKVQEYLALHPEVDTLWIQYAHPLSGERIDLDQLAEFSAGRGLRWIIDAETQFGADRIDIEKWPVDVLISRSDAALHGPAGGAIVLQRKASQDKQERGYPLWLQLSPLVQHLDDIALENAAQLQQLPSHWLQGLFAALKDSNSTGGWLARKRHYQRHQNSMQRLLKRYGVKAMSSEAAFPGIQKYQLPSLMPKQRLAEELLRQGFVINTELTQEEHQIAIALMGDIDELPLARLHQALEDILHPVSVKIDH